MNVGSLKLCRELHRLSGWSDCTYYYHKSPNVDRYYVASSSVTARRASPAYDLGYLLRKLPQNLHSGGYWLRIEIEPTQASASYRDPSYHTYFVVKEIYRCKEYGQTLEDAAAKLAIELFKQGVLARDGDGA